MGLISDLAKSVDKSRLLERDRGSLWRQSFGTDKERGVRAGPAPVDGGSYGRSVTTTEASFKRLLQAMRSMAPGGWSDDRYEQTRHFLGVAYVSIHRLCMQLSQAEYQVFHQDDSAPEGKRPVTKMDPPEGGRLVKPYDLVNLLAKPNRQDHFGKWMYRLFQQKYLTGTGLNWKVPNILGVPMEMYVIPTAIAIPQPAVNPDFPDGFYRIQPLYPYGPFSSYPTPASAVGAPIPAQWMTRIQYPHPFLRYEGYSPQTGMRLHLDEVESIDRSRWYSMKRVVSPSAVLNFDEMEGAQPLPMEEVDRIRSEFENTQMGPENYGQLYVATPGASLEPWGPRNVDMEYQQGWEQLVSFCMGGFGITKPAAGMVQDSSYSTLFATLKQLSLVTLDPECADLGATLTMDLGPYFGDDLIVEVRCRRIDDPEIKRQKLDQLMQAKAITKNEMRMAHGEPLTTEAWGSEIAGADSLPAVPNMPGQQTGQEQPAGEMGLNPEERQPDELRPEPAEIANDRPQMIDMSTGALGPRNDQKKSFATNGRH